LAVDASITQHPHHAQQPSANTFSRLHTTADSSRQISNYTAFRPLLNSCSERASCSQGPARMLAHGDMACVGIDNRQHEKVMFPQVDNGNEPEKKDNFLFLR